ncbi:hypothetical protein S83_015072 [Arachis hypogaea]
MLSNFQLSHCHVLLSAEVASPRCGRISNLTTFHLQSFLSQKKKVDKEGLAFGVVKEVGTDAAQISARPIHQSLWSEQFSIAELSDKVIQHASDVMLLKNVEREYWKVYASVDPELSGTPGRSNLGSAAEDGGGALSIDSGIGSATFIGEVGKGYWPLPQ